MITRKPLTLIWIGLVGMLLGVILPFLMILKLLPSTLFLNFFAFTVSVGGLFLGVIGVAMYARLKKDDPMERR